MAVETFETLNSVYEIDQDERLIRRIEGVNYPTPNQGHDGEWREYTELSWWPPESHRRLLIRWDAESCTLTSPVGTPLEVRS